MKSLYAGVGLLLVVAAAVTFGLANHQPVDAAQTVRAKSLILHEAAVEQEGWGESSEEQHRFVQQLAIQLLEQYGEQIHLKSVQAKMLAVRAYVIDTYSQEGPALFQRVLMTAFPRFINEIIKTLELLAEYEEWLASNYLTLNAMTLLEREGTLWEKRRALFGKDAEQIWAHESQHAALQQQAQDELERLDQAHEETLDETLFQLRSSLEHIYSGGYTGIAIDNGLVAQVYFGLDSVQRKLQAMEPEQRQQQINDVRRQLGYSAERIDQLEARDQQRNKRWEIGAGYMQERQQLLETLSGEKLEFSLARLREQYFKHEAQTIRKEEAQGFYRYERPRVFGRN